MDITEENQMKQGLEKSKPKHWSQINIYGYYEKLQYGLYLIENKNDSDITIEIVKLDWALGQALEAKAWEIINSRTPPARISNEPSYFDCKFCSFREICHYKAKVEHNCRSCRYSVPTKDASWTCDKFGLIPPEFVKIGCNQHISINGE